jgi:hypothetical protein
MLETDYTPILESTVGMASHVPDESVVVLSVKGASLFTRISPLSEIPRRGIRRVVPRDAG